MRLKDYQLDVLDALERYLGILESEKSDAFDYYDFQQSKGKNPTLGDYTTAAWQAGQTQGVVASSLAHKSYYDGLGQPIPSLCLKVPTGGGKTLLATKAVDLIQTRYFKRQTGLVLWIVPSSAIYQQTKAQLSKKSHPYRQMLERASGGRVKFFEKGATLTKQDTDNHLCVMLMMLQASNRKTKDVLKMFQNSGSYSDFFPDVDDYAALNAFWQATPNLDRYDLGDDFQPSVNTGIAIKQSLGNTLRLLRPMIVVDEGHKAYSEGARDTLTGFNPSFILELSATPNMRSHGSNVLCDVSGMALLREEMIKLPIVIDDHLGKTWKAALEDAWEQTQSLDKDATKNKKTTGDYIRPILLVRVDRTGKEQRDNKFLHSEDVREYMSGTLGLQPNAIRVKSASKDEIAGEDLLSPYSPVRVIITKDALREGWDCPFAYVLAVLSTSKSETAMTQMIGRVLRQPYARRANIKSLNMCYVHCLDQDVKDVVNRIRKGLEDEGMTEVDQFILGASGATDSVPMEQITLKRRKAWKGRKILLPRVLVRDSNASGGTDARPIDYDRDILGALDWEALSYRKADTVTLADDLSLSTRTVLQLVEVEEQYDLLATSPSEKVKHEIEPQAVQHLAAKINQLGQSFLIRKLIDLVPNPWQAARILNDAMATLLARPEYNEARLEKSKLSLIDAIKTDLREQIEEQSEIIFRAKVKSGEITFRLLGSGMDFAMKDSITINIPRGAGLLTSHGKELQKPLYEKIYAPQLNSLEQQAAIYLDGQDPLKWWHRVAVSAQKDYFLQGWKRAKVFPDFLCWMELDSDGGAARLLALETKGKHLDGSDTAWKEKLFDVLQEAYESGQELGQLELTDKQAEKMTFKLLMQTQDEKAMLNELAGVIGVK